VIYEICFPFVYALGLISIIENLNGHMKHLLSILLLVAIAAMAHAGKNAKAGKLKRPKIAPPSAVDTAWHGTGKEHYEYGARSYEQCTARDGYVDIDSATAAKYGATGPTL
jgi:hypothetical protein